MLKCIDNNEVFVIGKVYDNLTLSHTLYGEDFYGFTVQIPRLSQNNDFIKVIVSGRLLESNEIKKGDTVEITGQFRSYNNYVNPGNKLVLTVFAQNIFKTDATINTNPNQVYLNGYICKQPTYRTTPFGREIADLLIAVNRTYNKSDYIPAIVWGRNARFCKNLKVGQNIKIFGRLQSREYKKKINETDSQTRTAYEVSISKIELAGDAVQSQDET